MRLIRDVASWLAAWPQPLRADGRVEVTNTYFDPSHLGLLRNRLDRVRRFDRRLRSHMDKRAGLRAWEYGMLLASVSVWEGVRVLDVGCGRSPFGLYLASEGAGVTLFDLPAPHERDPAFERRVARSGVRLAQGTMLALPFPDGSFDAVISVSAVEHLQEDPVDPRRTIPREAFLDHTRRAVSEMGRVLAPGGLVYLSSDAHDPERQRGDAYRGSSPGEPIACAYRPEDLQAVFLGSLVERGLALRGPADYDLARILEDPRRATYRGRWFSTFALAMERPA
ncbi:MAG: class I SAM-dependent methyltransferase [Planctomycetes bacterium]|nr:class I SAM-dependent methyltransferase [Planctomycetota bacterium]